MTSSQQASRASCDSLTDGELADLAQIEEWEERLEQYQHRAEQGRDMSAPIGNAKQKLESLRREPEEELSRLEEEKHVTPQEPELVTAAYVVSPTEAKDE